MNYIIQQNSTVTIGGATPPPVTGIAAEILSDVADVFGVLTTEICSESRKTHAKNARWVFWYILRRIGYTQQACADITGHDHSSVKNAEDKLPGDIKNNPMLGVLYGMVSHHIIDFYAKEDIAA